MKVCLISLGCAKNQVDSENLAGSLREAGHVLQDDVEGSDWAIVNTCGFIEAAVKESIDLILDLEELKREGLVSHIAVVGCLYNRYDSDLVREFPTVDLWTFASDWKRVLAALGSDFKRARAMLPGDSPWSRYLKIAEGCDNRCSYCMIPSIRGRLSSMPLKAVIEEAERLVASGAKELCLVAQDLTSYGMDWDGNSHLLELLKILKRDLPEETWLRLLYLHPARLDEPFLEAVLEEGLALPYLDIPIQHVDEAILTRMSRRMSEEGLRCIFSYARGLNPDVALRTTVMVGFPGESEQSLLRLLAFLKDMEIDRVGAFAFSPEDGTEASKMPGQISARVKEERLQRVMELQAEISLRRQMRMVGRCLKVLVLERDDDGTILGRSYRDAPEVDGIVELVGEGLKTGEFVTARVVEALEHDLVAEVV